MRPGGIAALLTCALPWACDAHNCTEWPDKTSQVAWLCRVRVDDSFDKSHQLAIPDWPDPYPVLVLWRIPLAGTKYDYFDVKGVVTKNAAPASFLSNCPPDDTGACDTSDPTPRRWLQVIHDDASLSVPYVVNVVDTKGNKVSIDPTIVNSAKLVPLLQPARSPAPAASAAARRPARADRQ